MGQVLVLSRGVLSYPLELYWGHAMSGSTYCVELFPALLVYLVFYIGKMERHGLRTSRCLRRLFANWFHEDIFDQ